MDNGEDSECGISDSNLCCVICWDHFTNPTLLACAHTFCRGCLDDLAHKSHQRGCLVCPECRDVTRLPEEGVQGLKRNISVQRLVDEHSHARKMAAFECAVHPKEVENIFCVTCSRRVCLQCMLDEHNGHDVMTRQKFVSRQTKFIRRHRERKAAIEDRIAMVEARREQIDDAHGGVEDDIRVAFDHQVALLLKEKDSLLEAVRSHRDDYGSKLDGMVAGYRQHLEDMSSALRQTQMANDKTTMNLDMDSLTILNERGDILEKIFKMPIVDDTSLRLKEHADRIRFVGKDTDTDIVRLGDIQVPEEKVDEEGSDQEPEAQTELVTNATWLRQKTWHLLSTPQQLIPTQLFHSFDKLKSLAKSSHEEGMDIFFPN